MVISQAERARTIDLQVREIRRHTENRDKDKNVMLKW